MLQKPKTTFTDKEYSEIGQTDWILEIAPYETWNKKHSTFHVGRYVLWPIISDYWYLLYFTNVRELLYNNGQAPDKEQFLCCTNDWRKYAKHSEHPTCITIAKTYLQYLPSSGVMVYLYIGIETIFLKPNLNFVTYSSE